MRLDLVPPDSDTERPRHWVRHDQAFATMLGPGSIEWGSKRSALETFDYAACDLALCDRHEGEWVGFMNVPHLQLGISDAALMAACDEPNGEVELHPYRKLADSRLGMRRTGPSALAKGHRVGPGQDGRRVGLDEMALSVGLSTARFARMFRKSTGKTPHQFVLRQRLERAKAMLRAPDARVLDVPVACGFKQINSSAIRSR